MLATDEEPTETGRVAWNLEKGPLRPVSRMLQFLSQQRLLAHQKASTQTDIESSLSIVISCEGGGGGRGLGKTKVI